MGTFLTQQFDKDIIKNCIEQDRDIGYWIKKVPYVLSIENNEVNGRYYIVDISALKDQGFIDNNFKFSFLDKMKECPLTIKDYFQIYKDSDKSVSFDTIFFIEGHILQIPSFVKDKFTFRIILYLTYKPPFKKDESVKKIIQNNFIESPEIKLDKLKEISLSKLKYEGNKRSLVNLFYIIYLGRKYKEACFIFKNTASILPLSFPSYETLFSYTIKIFDDNFNKIEYDSKSYFFRKSIEKCIKNDEKRLVFIPLSVQYFFIKGAHATLLILDKIRKKIYFFDPHGQTEYIQFHNIVPKIVEDIYPSYKKEGYKFIHTPEYCPYAVFQRLENDVDTQEGFCANWVFWLIEQILINPNIELDTLIFQSQNHILKTYHDVGKYIKEYAYISHLASETISSELAFEKRLSKLNDPTSEYNKKLQDFLIKEFVKNSKKIL